MAEDGPKLEILTSRQLTAWMAEQHLSLAFSTYQSGKLFLLGLQPDGRLAVFERTFNRAMGLCAHGRQLYLSTLYQLWRFDDALEPGQAHQGHDRLYVPQLAWTTGDLDIHDVAVTGGGRVVFVNTLFYLPLLFWLVRAPYGRHFRGATPGPKRAVRGFADIVQTIRDVRGIPVNTVRSQLFRARAALRDLLTGAAAPKVER